MFSIFRTVSIEAGSSTCYSIHLIEKNDGREGYFFIVKNLKKKGIVGGKAGVELTGMCVCAKWLSAPITTQDSANERTPLRQLSTQERHKSRHTNLP